MEVKKTERICLGSNGKQVVTEFNSDLNKANQAAREFASMLGVRYNTDMVQDLISGGVASESQLNNMIKTALDRAVFPFQREEIQVYAHKMRESFSGVVKLCKRLISSDYGTSAKMFYVDADNSMKLCDEGVELINDAEKLYIDKPEQIEVYNDCNAIIEAIAQLNDKVSDYGMTATYGGRAVLTTLPDGNVHLNSHNIADCYTGNFFQRYNGTEIKTENVSENAKSGH